MEICKICNKEFKNLNPIGRHLKFCHNISIKEYYDKYLKSDNEGFCLKCNKPTKIFKINKGYCKFCSNKCAQSYIEIIAKKEKTFLNNYGVKNISQDNNIKKLKTKTCNEHYGVDYPQQSKIIQDNTKLTILEKYNVNHISKNNEIILKTRQTKLNNTLNKLKLKNSKIINYSYDKHVTIFCEICNNTYILTDTTIRKRINKNIDLCPICNKKQGISFLEKEITNFIKTFYCDKIIENDKLILNGKELDIYLPKLKLAFEIDGTYWHADPRFYCATDKILNKYATTIWENDFKKDILCNNYNIKLFRIKEYDWKNDNINIKNRIKDLIEVNNKC